jgi:hypothetical protein
MKLHLIAAALCTVAAPAAATDWQVVTASDNNGEIRLHWVDMDSIEANGSHRTVWTYMVSRKEAIKTVAEFDCSDNRIRISNASVENPDGSVRQVPGTSDWNTIDADEPLNTVVKFVCSGGTSERKLNFAAPGESPVAMSREVLAGFYAEKEAGQ